MNGDTLSAMSEGQSTNDGIGGSSMMRDDRNQLSRRGFVQTAALRPAALARRI